MAWEENPLSYWCILQLPLLVGVWRLGDTLAAMAMKRGPLERVAVGILVSVGSWLIAVQLATRLCGSFEVGLWLGGSAAAVAGVALRRFRPPVPAPPWSKDDRFIVVSAIAASLPILAAGLGGDFHDELVVFGHQPTIRQFQNDAIPPRNLADPREPLRYHYGFAIASAALTAWFRIPVATTIDIVTTLGWGLSWILLCSIGRRLTAGTSSGVIFAFVTLFGGGAAWLLLFRLGDLTWPDILAGHVTIGLGRFLNPPIVSYIFQHPYSLGLPTALAATLIVLEDDDRDSQAASWLAIGILLAALSMFQTALFATLGFTIAFERIILRRRPAFILVCVVVVLCAAALGGMYSKVSQSPGLGIYFRIWALERSPLRVLAWNGLTYGALLPLGLLGITRLNRGWFLIGFQALGGVLVPNLFEYRYSWDIVKFATGGQLFLGIASGYYVIYCRRSESSLLRAIGTIAVPVLTGAGLLYLVSVFYSQWYAGVPTSFVVRPAALDVDDLRCAGWLRMHAERDKLIYVRPDRASGYVQHAGVAATTDQMPNADSFGLDVALLDSRTRMLARRPSELDEYVRYGVKYFVVDDQDSKMNANIATWLASGKVQELNAFGAVRVYAATANPPH
jgi:hypothetical protein